MGRIARPVCDYVGDRTVGCLATRLAVGLAPKAGLASNRHYRTDGNSPVKLQIDSERCQGHGRCYDLAPDLFGDDDEGFGKVLGEGVVPPGQDREARLAVANCPERAIDLLEET